MLAVPLARGRMRARVGPLCGPLLMLLLNGCASTGGSASYDTAKAEYDRSASSSSAPGRASAPLDFGAAVLERGAYVRAVLERNPTLESARQGFRAALARVGQSGALEDPMIDLGLAPLSVASSKAPLGYQLGISQKLPWFGKRSLESSAAAADAAAVKSDFDALQRELALSAVGLYDQYFVLVRSTEINLHHVELMRSMRDAATAQFEVGRGSAQDPLQAEVELAHMEHDSAILASQRDVIVAQMNELLHRAPELPLPPPPRELERARASVPNASEAPKLEADALAQRSEISAARQRGQAAQARADRADREYYPDLTVSTSYNSMWDTPEHRWMVGLGFNLPIQSGRRAGAADEALAQRAQFDSEVERMSDAARTQVFVALKQLQESEHVLGLFESRLLPVARAQIDAARAGFVASQNSFLAAVEAEKNLRSVELDYETARADFDRRRAELDRARGLIPGLDAQGEKP